MIDKVNFMTFLLTKAKTYIICIDINKKIKFILKKQVFILLIWSNARNCFIYKNTFF